MTGDTLLETLQADVVAILKNCPELADANVIPEDAGDMEKTIMQKLGTLTGGGLSKPGLVIVVLLPEITDAETNLPGPPVAVTITLQVIEQPLINRGTGGTGIRSSVAALRALAALHLRGLGHCALHAGPDAVKPLQIKPGFLSHVVKLAIAYSGLTPPAKCGQVSATWDNFAAALVLSCATVGAAIYYTDDGTYPAPNPPDSTIYTGPITGLADGTVVRAAAYLAATLPGDLTQVTITDGTPS